jgi:hypothetical protein
MELMEMTNDILTKDALDEIFEIGHYSLETTKQKRSFFINEINSRGKIKITRQRRVDDQRSYDYLISFLSNKLYRMPKVFQLCFQHSRKIIE